MLSNEHASLFSAVLCTEEGWQTGDMEESSLSYNNSGAMPVNAA